MQKLIKENFHFMMPYNLGVIGIKAYKLGVNSLSVDMHNSKKYRKVIKFVNDHTWNYSFGFIWNKERCLFRNRVFYHFKVAKHFAKQLSEEIFERSKDPNKRAFIRT